MAEYIVDIEKRKTKKSEYERELVRKLGEISAEELLDNYISHLDEMYEEANELEWENADIESKRVLNTKAGYLRDLTGYLLSDPFFEKAVEFYTIVMERAERLPTDLEYTFFVSQFQNAIDIGRFGEDGLENNTKISHKAYIDRLDVIIKTLANGPRIYLNEIDISAKNKEIIENQAKEGSLQVYRARKKDKEYRDEYWIA